MKEVEIKDLVKYKDPMTFREGPGIAVASDGVETNGLTVGWGGFGVLWRKPMCTIYIHATRYSKHIFDKAEYFSLNFMDEEHKSQNGYFGRVSGRDENKMEKCGMKVENDLAPYFSESKVVLICRIMGRSDFDVKNVDESVKDWYEKEGVHTIYHGEIVKVLVKE